MKIRNNSSKAFHNSETPNANHKSFSNLVDRITAKIDTSKDLKFAISAFRQIIERCYNNKNAQQELCQVLNLPFIPGPVSLNAIPYSFFHQQYLTTKDIEASVMNQISYLFEYLKRTREYFYCWIIYFNEELKILTVKMMKKYQLKQNIELLNSKYCLIGIFVDREVNLSTNVNSKISVNKNSLKETQKLSAYSCYNQPTKKLSQKQMKPNNFPKKAVQKITNSESVYSLKSLKSSSKTNSSSFKNKKSNNQSEIQSSQNQLSQAMSVQNSQKYQNFKKKKNKLITFGQTKIQKSQSKSKSTKFQAFKNSLNILKSFQKMELGQKKLSPRKTKSTSKLGILRGMSNTDKIRVQVKSIQLTAPNKIQLQKYKKQSTQKGCKRGSSLIKSKKLSKSSKIYSSCGSLNVTSSSKSGCMKEAQQKVAQSFIKRKVSSKANNGNFKKKKINPIKFSYSSKNSFDIE